MIKIIKKKQTYAQYVEHQKSKILNYLKTPKLSLSRVNFFFYDKMLYNALTKRIKRITELPQKGNCLCLGARMGTEVRAFISLGYFSVGIDLEPCRHNKYVVTGDFHNIQYSPKSVDIVYTNSFDHSNKPDVLLKEVRRVLKDEGVFILEVSKGTQEGYKPQDYECTTWDTFIDVIKYCESKNWTLQKVYLDSIPFDLNCLIFTKTRGTQ